MSGKDPGKTQATQTAETAEGEERTVHLSGGRTLTVSGDASDLVEIRNPSGMLELRVRLTDEGPVLAMESVKLSLKAAETVAVACRSFEVKAEEGVTLEARGELELRADKDVKITSTEEIKVVGKMIYLN